MTSNLLGKVALITGGAQGLGRSFAEHLLARGVKVALVDVNGEVGKKTEHELKQQHGANSTLFVQCDVSDGPQLQGAFDMTKKTFGGLDIVINNAGIFDEINWRKMIAINLSAVIDGSYLGLEAMRTDKGGRGGLIINTSSLAAEICPVLFQSYSASKAGIVAFTRSFAKTYPVELLGIRISCICPSAAETVLVDHIVQAAHEKKSTVLHAQAETFLQRMEGRDIMQPSYVAKAFMRLVDDERAHGAVLAVSPEGLEYLYPEKLAGKLEVQ